MCVLGLKKERDTVSMRNESTPSSKMTGWIKKTKKNKLIQFVYYVRRFFERFFRFSSKVGPAVEKKIITSGETND